ncbi:MAG: hypothetical protein J7K82_04390, partial [Thermoproteales archaeon]|nr:hypothetical protein [Thermoproteales archaeon]
MSSTALKVLLDSTYLLPSFGIEVEGLQNEHIVQLREAVIKDKIRFYCLTVVWVEVIGKVFRESQRLKLDIEEILDVTIKSLLESEFYEWIQPTSEAVKLAFKLRKLGHRDNIDNLLYATSITNNMIFLTMDENFKNFLLKEGYKVNNLMNHT